MKLNTHDNNVKSNDISFSFLLSNLKSVQMNWRLVTCTALLFSSQPPTHTMYPGNRPKIQVNPLTAGGAYIRVFFFY